MHVIHMFRMTLWLSIALCKVIQSAEHCSLTKLCTTLLAEYMKTVYIGAHPIT